MTTARLSREYSITMNFDFFEICITDQILEDSDLLDSFLFDCQCALFLIDITDKESFNKIENLVGKFEFSEYSYLKIIVLENKIDKESDRQISSEEIDSFMKENNIEDRMKISLKDGTGFEELVEKMNSFTNNKENDIPINFISQDNSQRSDININKDIKKDINLILIGDSNVGKTCFFTRFNKNEFKESFLSTIGMDKHIKLYKYKDEELKIIIWDTAGQDRYKSLPKKYYEKADGIFIMFDVTNKESFNDVSVWMNEINNNTKFEEGENKDNNDNKIIVYLIGNKIDKLKRCVNKEEAEEKASFYGIKYFEISCKINMNIAEVSARMINDCIIKYEERNEEKQEAKLDSFTINKPKKKESHNNKGCCG